MRGRFKYNWVKDKILSVLYPITCPVCGEVLKPPGMICKGCLDKLSYITEPRCKKCGKQIDGMEREYCYDCSHKNHEFKHGIAVFQYNEAIKKSIYRYKYHNKREYSLFYGKEIASLYNGLIQYWNVDAVVPVPLHKAKQRKRGFNQAEVLAKEVAINMNLPMDKHLLIRIKKTIPQKELSHRERKMNIKEAFMINPKRKACVYKKILLIDDIYTTGSTLDECAKVLKKYGVDEVYFITLAIGYGI